MAANSLENQEQDEATVEDMLQGSTKRTVAVISVSSWGKKSHVQPGVDQM